MTAVLTKVGRKHRVVIPEAIRREVGLSEGDMIEIRSAQRGKVILLRPKIVVDRDYIKRRLDQAEADVKAGRVSKPFRTARAALAALKRRAHARRVH